MNSRLAQLARRKQDLIGRCALQRGQLAQSSQQLKAPYLIAATIGGLMRVARSRPALLIGLSGLLGRRVARLGRVAGLSLALWQALRPRPSPGSKSRRRK